MPLSPNFCLLILNVFIFEMSFSQVTEMEPWVLDFVLSVCSFGTSAFNAVTGVWICTILQLVSDFLICSLAPPPISPPPLPQLRLFNLLWFNSFFRLFILT